MARHQMSGRARLYVLIGGVFVAVRALPFIVPTTFLYTFPTARAAFNFQNELVQRNGCEVCGETHGGGGERCCLNHAPGEGEHHDGRVREAHFAYKAQIDDSCFRFADDHNPSGWPGNCEVVYCEDHADYPALRRPGRRVDYRKGERNGLSHRAFFYLLLHGCNPWLRAAVGLHAGVALFGMGLMVFAGRLVPRRD